MGKRVIESPIPFVLKRIFIEKSNGALFIKGDSFEKSLYFIEGNLVFAKTNVLHERLGEVLFKIGKINQTQFWDIHKLVSSQKIKLGQILVENDTISQKDLFFGLLYQVRIIALSTFSMTSGEWDFSTTLPEISDDSRFRIELPGIFSEGVSRFKSMPLFKKSFLHNLLHTKPVSSEISSLLRAEEIVLFKKLSAYSNVSVEQIGSELQVPDDFFWQKILFFFLLNILEFPKPIIDKELSKNFEELFSLYEKLKTGEMDYYELFAVSNSATFNEIKDIYFQYAKKFHPDRIGDVQNPAIKEKANFVFSLINKAFEVLSNEEKRREYDIKGYKEIQNKDSNPENLIEKANLYYRKAKTLYRQSRFLEAASVLEESVRLDANKASYFLLLGLSQSNLPNLRRQAEKSFQKVVELEPWSAEPYAALGLLFLSEKLDKRAEGFFRKALAIDPEHELSKKKLAELSGGDKKQSMFSIFQKKK